MRMNETESLDYSKRPLFHPESEVAFITIASGPVIIQNGKVLLTREGENQWQFPGGKMRPGESFETTARREAFEETGLLVSLMGKPVFVRLDLKLDQHPHTIILVHFLAQIPSGAETKPGKDITCEWFGIQNLPEEVGQNIKPVIEYFTQN